MKYLVTLFLCLGIALVQGDDDSSVGISSIRVIRPRSMSVQFWTAERMLAAREATLIVPMENANVSQARRISVGPEATIAAVNPEIGGPSSRALNTAGRHAVTTGRVFWSCQAGYQSSCSASVISSTSGDVIVTAGHCVYDTNSLSWLVNCNWVFVPGYNNGQAPYGIWPAREVAALNTWTKENPDYNADVAFVALSQVNGKHITQVTGSQAIGFNYARGQQTFSFGYPVNLANGQVLQFCSGVPAASLYTADNYQGLGLSSCLMTGGSSGGPWLQRFDESTGVGTTYSVNSFTYSLAPNTMNGPYFDSNIQSLWNYITSR